MKTKAITFIKKLILLTVGFFLYAVGILLTIHAQLGAAPWDTFHIGLVNHTGLTLGQVSQIVGMMIVLANIAMKEVPGWGTILNTYFIGYFIDLIEGFSLIPNVQSLFGKIVMLLAGILIIGWGTFFYMNTGWGAGPRDGLMLGLSRCFSTGVWKARTAIEIVVVAAGFILGATPGVGTIVLALLIGPTVEITYRIGRKDPKTVKHRTFVDDYKVFTSLRKRFRMAEKH
ncbi:MAG: YczE/YyaS/YitT family protein [bacterium]|jgi:uncharacterized membrane protein YczE